MFGLFDDISDMVGGAIGTVCGIAVAPVAIALGASESLVKSAIESGCTTVDEIRNFIDDI